MSDEIDEWKVHVIMKCMHIYCCICLKQQLTLTGYGILIARRTLGGCDRCCFVGVVGWDCFVDALFNRHSVGHTAWLTLTRHEYTVCPISGVSRPCPELDHPSKLILVSHQGSQWRGLLPWI